jgi:protein SCO1/2
MRWLSRVERPLRPLVLATTLASALALSAVADNSATPPRLPGRVAIDQHLDRQLPLSVPFKDENGRAVTLGDYFKDKPVVLNFVYFQCPMLCSIVEDGLTNSLTELKFTIGKEFDVLTISFDPRDTPRGAWAKKDKYTRRYGRASAREGWHFLTGTESAIAKVTDAAGFRYAWDPQLGQFAHATTVIVVTPQGKISRYIYGFEYHARDLHLALVEASAGKIGSLTDALLLMCYHYDPATGKYSRIAMNYVRLGGAATVLALASFIIVMIRREKLRLHSEDSGRTIPFSQRGGGRSGRPTQGSAQSDSTQRDQWR